jgi:hypothetical protein
MPASDEAPLGLARGVARVRQRAAHRHADLARGLHVLLAHLVEATQPAIQRFHDRGQRAGLDPGAFPAFGLDPALERGVHARELGAEHAQIFGGPGHLPLMREQRLHLLGETREITPAGARGQAAQLGDPPGRKAA